MKDLVSIIIPVYNVQDFLYDSVMSAVNQDYENTEILLIDDGSTDNSGEICDEIQTKYSNVFVYHKINGGLSSARNYGMSKAKGDYYYFLDSDDTISKYSISFLMQIIKKYSTKIATADMKVVNSPGYKNDNDGLASETELLSLNEAMIRMMTRKNLGVSAGGKLFHRDLFEGVLFPVGKVYEDLQTIPYVLMKCNNVGYSKEAMYYWYQRSNSITHSSLRETDFEELDYLNNLVQTIKEKCPDAYEAAICRYVDDIFFVLIYRMVNANKWDKYILVRDALIKYYNDIMSNRYLKKNKKIQTLMFAFTPHIYRILVKFMGKGK